MYLEHYRLLKHGVSNNFFLQIIEICDEPAQPGPALNLPDSLIISQNEMKIQEFEIHCMTRILTLKVLCKVWNKKSYKVLKA